MTPSSFIPDTPALPKSFQPDMALPKSFQADPAPVRDLPQLPAPQLPYELQQPDEQKANLGSAPSSTSLSATGPQYRRIPTGQGNELENQMDPVAGLQTAYEGAAQTTRPGLRAKAGGVHKIIAGGFQAATPIMLASGIAAPVETAAGLAAGMGTQTVTTSGLKYLGVPDEYADLAGDVTGFAAGAGAAKAAGGAVPKPSVYETPIPETHATIDVQMQQLAGGQRRAVLLTPGEDAPPLPPGTQTVKTEVGDVVFDPKQISPRQVKRAAKFGRMNEVLGAADGGMGPQSKADITATGEEPVAVVGKTADGTVTQGTLATDEGLPAAEAQTAKVTPPDGTVDIEAPSEELARRARALQQEATTNTPDVDVAESPAPESLDADTPALADASAAPVAPQAELPPSFVPDDAPVTEGKAPWEMSQREFRDSLDTPALAQAHDNSVRMRGMEISTDAQVQGFFKQIRRAVESQPIPEEMQASSLERLTQAETAYHAGDLSRATQLSEGLITDLHGAATDIGLSDQLYREAGQRAIEQGLPIHKNVAAVMGKIPDGYARNGSDLLVPAARNGSEHGGVPATLLVTPLERFLTDDALPAARSAAEGVHAIVDEARKGLAPDTRGVESERTGGRLREMLAERAQRLDRVATAFESARKFFARPAMAATRGDANARASILEFYGAGERGIKLPDSKLQGFIDAAHAMFEDRADQIQRLGTGALKSMIEDYLPHIYKDPTKAGSIFRDMMARKPLEGNKDFLKQRVIEYLDEAYDMHGLEPLSWNPVDMWVARVSQMDKFITAQNLKAQMKGSKDIVFSSGMKPPQEGWAQINDKMFHVQYRNAAGEMVQGGHFWAPEPVARIINNYLDPGLSSSSMYRGWRSLTNFMNMIELGGSFYHGLTTTLNSTFSDLALGMKQLSRGQVKSAAPAIARSVVPLASVFHDFFKGYHLQKVWDGAAAPKNATEAYVVDALKAAGGRARLDTYHSTHITEGMLNAFREYNVPGGVLRAPFALMETVFTRPIMEGLVPRVKLGAFAKRIQADLEAGATPRNRMQARQQFGKIWDSMDNRFGQLVYDNMLMNRMARDIMMAVVGRPGWNLGTVREIGGGAYDVAKNINDLAHLRAPQLSDRTAYTAAMAMSTLMINGIINFGLTGEAPSGMDYIAPRDGGTNDDGRPSRLILPSYLGKDIMSYYSHPLTTVTSKSAPAISAASDLIRNEDYWHRKIYGTGGQGVGHYLTNNYLQPYAVQGLRRNIEKGVGPLKASLPFVGIMPASPRMSYTKSEELLAEYHDQDRARVQLALPEKFALEGQLTRLQRTQIAATKNNDAAGANAASEQFAQVARKAYNDGKLTEAMIRRSMDRANMPPLAADFKNLRDDQQKLDVMQAATPKELEILGPVYANELERGFAKKAPEDQRKIAVRLQSMPRIRAAIQAAAAKLSQQ